MQENSEFQNDAISFSDISKKSPSPNRIPTYCSELQNPCNDPACEPYFDCDPAPIETPQIYLEDFFNNYDKALLQNPDSNIVKNYLIQKNNELINILCTYFPNTYKKSELRADDVYVTLAGLTHMLAEGQGHFSGNSVTVLRIAMDWGCVGNVLMGLIDVVSLVEDYVSLIQGGGTWTTVRGLLWRTLKRYAGWVGVAGVIYEISTECTTI